MKFSEVVKNACVRAGEAVPNMDPETGIAYGVVNSCDDILNYDAIEDVFVEGVDQDAGDLVREEINRISDVIMGWGAHGYPEDPTDALFRESPHVDSGVLADLHGSGALPWTVKAVRAAIASRFDSDAFLSEQAWTPDDISDLLYEKDGYSIFQCGDGNMFIQKSPYYAFRGECAPTAPCAGHLRTPGDMKTYVLGPDWYARDPGFKIYRVDTDEEVKCDFSDIS